MELFTVWLEHTIFWSCIILGVFIWALRSGQFTNLNCQRHLPLNPDNPSDHSRLKPPGLIDRCTIPALLTMVAVLLVIVVWLAFKSS